MLRTAIAIDWDASRSLKPRSLILHIVSYEFSQKKKRGNFFDRTGSIKKVVFLTFRPAQKKCAALCRDGKIRWAGEQISTIEALAKTAANERGKDGIAHKTHTHTHKCKIKDKVKILKEAGGRVEGKT